MLRGRSDAGGGQSVAEGGPGSRNHRGVVAEGARGDERIRRRRHVEHRGEVDVDAERGQRDAGRPALVERERLAGGGDPSRRAVRWQGRQPLHLAALLIDHHQRRRGAEPRPPRREVPGSRAAARPVPCRRAGRAPRRRSHPGAARGACRRWRSPPYARSASDRPAVAGWRRPPPGTRTRFPRSARNRAPARPRRRRRRRRRSLRQRRPAPRPRPARPGGAARSRRAGCDAPSAGARRARPPRSGSPRRSGGRFAEQQLCHEDIPPFAVEPAVTDMDSHVTPAAASQEPDAGLVRGEELAD